MFANSVPIIAFAFACTLCSSSLSQESDQGDFLCSAQDPVLDPVLDIKGLDPVLDKGLDPVLDIKGPFSTPKPFQLDERFQLVQQNLVWKPTDGSPAPSGLAGPEGQKLKAFKIGVYFLDGNEAQRNAVKEYAAYWTDMANLPIKWDFDDKTKKHIRIRFNVNNNWSMYGRDMIVRNTSEDEETMRLGDLRY